MRANMLQQVHKLAYGALGSLAGPGGFCSLRRSLPANLDPERLSIAEPTALQLAKISFIIGMLRLKMLAVTGS